MRAPGTGLGPGPHSRAQARVWSPAVLPPGTEGPGGAAAHRATESGTTEHRQKRTHAAALPAGQPPGFPTPAAPRGPLAVWRRQTHLQTGGQAARAEALLGSTPGASSFRWASAGCWLPGPGSPRRVTAVACWGPGGAAGRLVACTDTPSTCAKMRPFHKRGQDAEARPSPQRPRPLCWGAIRVPEVTRRPPSPPGADWLLSRERTGRASGDKDDTGP